MLTETFPLIFIKITHTLTDILHILESGAGVIQRPISSIFGTNQHKKYSVDRYIGHKVIRKFEYPYMRYIAVKRSTEPILLIFVRFHYSLEKYARLIALNCAQIE